MAANRNQFILNLHLIGIAAAGTIALAAGAILLVACPGGETGFSVTHPAVWGPLLLLAIGLGLEQMLVKLLLSRVLKPTGKVAVVASRVSQGDLTMPDWARREGLDGLSSSMTTMRGFIPRRPRARAGEFPRGRAP